MRVSVEDTKCCGAGQCVLLVPQVFDQREEDGIVRLLDPSPPPELADAVREAEQMCPTGTISVSDGP
jgi:ferredoxin